jgi:ABC-type branched-subunit amino acid transport system ATPase component
LSAETGVAQTGPAEFGRAALRATGVTAGYGGDPVIRDISVQVEPGQVVSLVGANGSGKSTLLKSLVGVIRMSAGTVTVGEKDLTGRPPEDIARAGVGYVPQVDDVFAPLTVKENLEMGGYLLPSSQIRARIDEVVSVFPRLGTMLGRQAGKLSGGERKMLAMGRVLMISPSVFLLDEPTANLAPAIARSLLQDQVRRLATGGAAVLVVEQRARAVLAISDHTYVLAGGEVRMSGSPAELSESPAFVESFLGGTVARLPRTRHLVPDEIHRLAGHSHVSLPGCLSCVPTALLSARGKSPISSPGRR